MGIISSFCPYKTHIYYTFSRQHICSLQHGYNYFCLMLTNFKGSSYMSDFLLRMLPIQSSIWVVLWVLYAYFCLDCIYLPGKQFPQTYSITKIISCNVVQCCAMLSAMLSAMTRAMTRAMQHETCYNLQYYKEHQLQPNCEQFSKLKFSTLSPPKLRCRFSCLQSQMRNYAFIDSLIRTL